MATSPIKFKRGASFSTSLKIPDVLPDGTFRGWTPKAQIRRVGNDLASGLIADLPVVWLDAGSTRLLIIQNDSTEDWPVCEAEFDVLFVSPKGQKVRSNTIKVSILKGVTRNDG